MNMNDLIEDFCAKLRQRNDALIVSASANQDGDCCDTSLHIARRTAEIIRKFIGSQRHASADSLLKDIASLGSKLQSARPTELTIGNTVRKILFIIREEKTREDTETEEGEDARAATAAAGPGPAATAASGAAVLGTTPSGRASSLSKAFQGGRSTGRGGTPAGTSRPSSATHAMEEDDAASVATSKTSSKPSAKKTPQWKGKQHILGILNEYIDEFDRIVDQIVDQAPNFIHANEVILTLGYSNTVLRFLRAAASGEDDKEKKKRAFQVVVAEGAPMYGGRKMAKDLAALGITTTLITDASIFAMMARVNKVVIGASALLANGGLLAPVGAHIVAQAAKVHAVPVVVLVGSHKLSPLFPHEPEQTMNEFRSPEEIVDYDVLTDAMAAANPSVTVHVLNPATDYVPPHLVSLLVTDLGGYSPSFVYRLLDEFYDKLDYSLGDESGGVGVAKG